MNDNVRKVFDMLGVEPNEKFKIKYSRNIAEDAIYYIDKKLRIYNQGNHFYYNEYLSQLLTGEFEIIKLSKKKKLRDLTPEEYYKWRIKNCDGECDKCLFHFVQCYTADSGWISHKDLYSDKFLDQEVEVE